MLLYSKIHLRMILNDTQYIGLISLYTVSFFPLKIRIVMFLSRGISLLQDTVCQINLGPFYEVTY